MDGSAVIGVTICAEEIIVKKLLLLVIVPVLALSGCATSGFLGFLATTQYVDLKTKTAQDQQAAEIAALKAQLADYQSVKDQAKAATDQAKAAVDQANESRKTLEDLQARIAQLPKDVIRQIADILQGSAAH